jgi:hypothetical protein
MVKHLQKQTRLPADFSNLQRATGEEEGKKRRLKGREMLNRTVSLF